MPGAITSLLLEDQLKRKDVKIMGNKLTMRQEIITEQDPYHSLKLIRMVNMKLYTDLQYKLIQQGAAFAAIFSEPIKISKIVI